MAPTKWECTAVLPGTAMIENPAVAEALLEDAVELKLHQLTGAYAQTITSTFVQEEAPVTAEAQEFVPTPEQEDELRAAIQEAVTAGNIVVTETPDGYAGLQAVLDAAFDQAAYGKGKERHACDRAFEDQPMQQISNLLQSNDGMAYQAIKKIQEAQRMDKDAAERELLGAIIYVAGMVIRLRGGAA